MSSIELRKIGITQLDADAIVNAANEGLWAGGGVCGAIFQAAGYQELEKACSKIGHCDTGSAVITPGFHSRAKYIIHAVGPRWAGGKKGEPDLLYNAYCKSLELAAANGCRSIVFPLISAGIFGYPLEGAWERAVAACGSFLDAHPKNDLEIIFAIPDPANLQTGKTVLRQSSASKYKVAEPDDFHVLPMPAQTDSFILQRNFTKEELRNLRRGHIPGAMEDKWFWYMEGDRLSAHRSWTGYCIFQMKVRPDGNHLVTVNRDSEQYGSSNVMKDAEELNDLLNWWVQPEYNYYGQWLMETVAALEKGQEENTGSGEILRIGEEEHEAVYFHLPEEENGYLSNWYLASFDLDGKHFTSSEQYLMYQKCILFGDEKSAEAVLATNDPAKQQAIGRKAAGYHDRVWAGHRQIAAFRGLLEKFRQNPELQQQLLDTGDAYLVECAGKDKIWACGIRLKDDRRHDIKNWTGGNLLGFTLMEVRSILRRASDD